MILYGASGHAKVIKDCLESNNLELKGIFDDDVHLEQFEGLDVHHGYRPDYFPEEKIIISVGDNNIRKRLSEKVSHPFGMISHKSVLVSPTSSIGFGTVVMHMSVVQASSIVGNHCILNTAATIDHDCRIGDFVHIAPGNTVCGNVSIGEGSMLGAGSTVMPGVRIGKWCVIGAGSVITADIPDFSLVMGVPGKTIKNLKSS